MAMTQLGGGVAANKQAAPVERIVNAGRAPTMFDDLRGRLRMGLVNMGRDELLPLGVEGDAVRVGFDHVSDVFQWSDLFPEWIDEEEEDSVPTCPDLPMPDLARFGDDVDVVVAALPCNRSAPAGWNRDVFRLQVHLAAAHVAARRGRRDAEGRVRVVLRSECGEPMMDLFRCDEAVGRDGHWWMYRVDVERLQEKLRLPVGSCNLALPLWGSSGGTCALFTTDLSLVPAGRPPCVRIHVHHLARHAKSRQTSGSVAPQTNTTGVTSTNHHQDRNASHIVSVRFKKHSGFTLNFRKHFCFV